MTVGKHTITVTAPAEGRYAPVIATGILDVSKAVTELSARLPAVVFIPGNTRFNGTARSELGPLQGASVRVSLDGNTREFRTAADGTFQEILGLGMNLGLVGSESFRVEVTPQEPWNESLVVGRKTLVVNTVGCAVFAVVLVTVGIIIPRRLRIRFPNLAWRRIKRQPAPKPLLSAEIAPHYVETTQSGQSQTDNTPDKLPVDPRQQVFSFYILIVKLVQRITRIMPTPQQTLREFANETRKVLGPLSGLLMEFTRLLERVLYSRSRATEKDVAQSEQYTREIQDGLKK
jgi:hypothetical protein